MLQQWKKPSGRSSYDRWCFWDTISKQNTVKQKEKQIKKVITKSMPSIQPIFMFLHFPLWCFTMCDLASCVAALQFSNAKKRRCLADPGFSSVQSCFRQHPPWHRIRCHRVGQYEYFVTYSYTWEYTSCVELPMLKATSSSKQLRAVKIARIYDTSWHERNLRIHLQIAREMK